MNYPRSSYLKKNKLNSYQKRIEKSEINSSFKLEYLNFNYVDTGADAAEPVWTNPDPSYTWRGITGKDALCNKAFHILYNNVDGIAGNHPDLPETLSRWDDFIGIEPAATAASLAAEGFVSPATDPYISGLDSRTPTDADPPALTYLLNSANMCGTTREGYYSDIIQKKFIAWIDSLTEGDANCAMAKFNCYGGSEGGGSPTGQIDTWERGAGYDPSKCEQLDQMCDNDSNGNPVLKPDYRTQMWIHGLKIATSDVINSWTWEGETGGKAMCTILDSACAEYSASDLNGDLLAPGMSQEEIEVMRYACNDWSTGNCDKTSSGIISYTPATETPTPALIPPALSPPATISEGGCAAVQSEMERIRSAKYEKDLEKSRENFMKLMLYGGGSALAIILILILIIMIK